MLRLSPAEIIQLERALDAEAASVPQLAKLVRDVAEAKAKAREIEGAALS